MSWSKWKARFGLTIILVVRSEASTLSGIVLDPAGWPLPHAQITLNSRESISALSSTITDASGKFAFAELAPGTYDLIALARGFAQFRQTGLLIGSAEDVQLPPIALKITGGCGHGDWTPPTRLRRILIKIKQFFVPIDWSKVEICQ